MNRPYIPFGAGSLQPLVRSLDLGCSEAPRNPFGANEVFGIDIRARPDANVVTADLAVEPIPSEEGVFDYVTAYDFLEHMPRLIYMPARRYPFVELMSEIWRVLKPGGVFLSVTPAYPYASAFMDPTHVNVLTEQTFPVYFREVDPVARMYGFRGAFRVASQSWEGYHLIAQLEKVAL